MANFLSRPKEFSNYVPEVNSELYARTLAKKDMEYQQGVRKVENIQSSVANLPVANEAGREYIQGISDKITSDINQKVGADWSDQHLQNQIGTHAAQLANDPTVNTIVANAAHVRNQFSNIETDTKMSKGANGINKMAFMDEYNEFANSKDPNQNFQSSYFNYQDVDKHLEDAFAKKHPNTKISVQSAGYSTDPKTGKQVYNPKMSMQQWDEEIHEWKGITPLDVRDEVSGILKANPNLQKQLDINSKYTYKNLTPDAMVEHKQNVLSEEKELLNRNLNEIDVQLGTVAPDSAEYQTLKQNKDYLENQIKTVIDPALTPQAKEQALRMYNQDPSLLESEKKDIYMKDWVNTQTKKFAYGEEKLDFKGKSPSEKQEWQADHGIKLQELALKQKADQRAEQTLKDKEAIARAKAAKEAAAFTTSEGINTENPVDSWTKFNAIYDNARKEVDDKSNLYLYNTYHDLFPDYFTGSSIKADVKDNKGNIVTSYTKLLKDLYQSRYEAYKNGNNRDNSGKIVDLGTRDYQFFAEVDGLNKVSLAMQHKIDEGKQAYANHIKDLEKNPEYKKSIDTFNEEKNNIEKQYGAGTADKILKSREAEKEIENFGKGKGFSFISEDDMEEIVKKHGFSNLQEYKNYTEGTFRKPFTTFINKKESLDNTIDDNKNKFLAAYVENNDYLSNPQSTQWVDMNLKDPKTNDVIEQKAIKLLKGQDSKILSSKEAGKQISISYVQEPLSGDYTMKIEDTKGNKETYPVASTDVPAEWKNYKDESTLNQLLRVNRDPYTKLSSTYATTEDAKEKHTFVDAMPLTIKEFNGKPTSVKYHVVQEGNSYYVEFWAKDITNPKDKGHILRDPKTNVKIEANTSSLKELEVLLDNYSKTGKTEPVGFSAGSEEEEETNQE